MVRSPARRSPRPHDSWDALADIEVFITAAEAELQAMDRERSGPRRRGRKPDPDLRRRMLGDCRVEALGATKQLSIRI